MAERGVAVTMDLVDAAGIVLWQGRSDAGVTQLSGRPPAAVLPRVVEIHVHLERLPLTGEPDLQPYLGLLACGCLVQYTYRPGLTAHCPTHGTTSVRRVDYPTIP
jgi:hypothetical protein